MAPAKPLHLVLAENRKQIVDMLVTAIHDGGVAPRPLTREQIVDHLNSYIVEMIGALERGLEETASGRERAREHGKQRWQIGYDLNRVVREYGVLHGVILELAAAVGAEVALDDHRALSTFLNAGIAEAVVEFAARAKADVDGALERARDATDAREEVLAVLSHDLKNPLNIVSGSAQRLLDELHDEDLASRRANLVRSAERIQRAAGRMNRLITDVLDLARIKSGEARLRTQPHRNDDLVRQATEHAVGLADERAVRFAVDIQVAGVVVCDAERVLQVLANLLGNAIKFSPVGGVVTVRSRRTDEVCTFEVADEGPGIPATSLPFVFNRFWQAPGTAPGGTGLGLAIAKGLVELHGGSIRVESPPGGGATFFVSLPSVPPPPGESVDHEGTPARTGADSARR